MSIDYAVGHALVSSIKDMTRGDTRDDRTTAVVTRVSGDEVWVRLEDSDIETRCSRVAVDVTEGDSVAVTVTGGRVYVESNYTNPSAGATATISGDGAPGASEAPSPSGSSSSEELAALASSVTENAVKIGELQKYLDKYFYVEGDELNIGSGDVDIAFSPKFKSLSPSQARKLLGEKSQTILINPTLLGVTGSASIAAVDLRYRGTIVQLTLANLSAELLSYLIGHPNIVNLGDDFRPVQKVYYDSGNFAMTIDTECNLNFAAADVSKITTVNATVMYLQMTSDVLGVAESIEPEIGFEDPYEGYQHGTDYDPPVLFDEPPDEGSQQE